MAVYFKTKVHVILSENKETLFVMATGIAFIFYCNIPLMYMYYHYMYMYQQYIRIMINSYHRDSLFISKMHNVEVHNVPRHIHSSKDGWGELSCIITHSTYG